MAVCMQIADAGAVIKHAQLRGLTGRDQDRRVTQRERKRSPIEHEDVGFALRRIIIAMHALFDFAQIAVGCRNAIEAVVDIHVDERIFALIFLARRLGHRDDAAGTWNQMSKMIVRPVRLDDEHAGETHERMHMVLHMTVIPECARRPRGEAIGE